MNLWKDAKLQFVEQLDKLEFGGDDYAYRTYCNVCK